MAFVHLHVHSQYSVLDGTMDPADVVAAAKAQGMSAVALTDTGNLYGAVAFQAACKEANLHGVVGAVLHVQPEGVGHADPDGPHGGYQVVVLVEDEAGYRALCWLVTRAIFDGMSWKPRVDLELLRSRHEGLVFLTGGLRGAFGTPALAGDEAGARARLAALAEAVGADRLYVELHDHGIEGQRQVNAVGRRLASELGLLTVVTNAVSYEKPEDAVAVEVLHAIAGGSSLADASRLVIPTDQAWFKTENELRAVFPEDAEALDRTVEVAARCQYAFKFGKFHFPATTPPDPSVAEGLPADTPANWRYFYAAFPPPRWFGLGFDDAVPPPFVPGAGHLDGYFAWYARAGLAVRLRDVDPALHPRYHEQLLHELGVVKAMGFAAYFLIVAEFINWSRDHGIPVGPGRGSAAGSLAAFAAGITDIDPIRFDLLFERFLNPGRKSMPDIDVDFCQDRREEVIEHVRARYGADLVSQIITFGSLKAKAAVKDVARVLDLGFDDANRLTSLVPDDLNVTLDKALRESEPLARLYDADPRVRRLLDLARRVEGLCRQTGVHAAGVVIADRPLVEYAPLYRDGPEGGPVVQFDMKSAEKIGLIKFDFLGLKTLDQIRDAVATIESLTGQALDISRIPVDDPATYALLQEGDALGVFQLESGGMRDLLGRLKPSCLDDIVALVALYRPGPLQSGMVTDFVERKHGLQEVRYPHPMLEPILASTYGTIVYQEQVMQIARVMGGYTLSGADDLRRAMGKKDAQEMAKQRDRFVDGAVARHVDREHASQIFDLLAKFAEYGFNKSHSAAYGYICYQTAWLKANHRAAYMAALMSIESGNTDKILLYVQDCRRAGVEILPVCVNGSARAFDVPREAAQAGRRVIRFGLGAVRNVGDGAVEAILQARGQVPFRDALDFFERVDPRALNRRAVESLVKAGAFDFTGVDRGVLFASVEALISEGSRRRAEAHSGQASLFGSAPVARSFRWAEAAPWSLLERTAAEKDALGLYLTDHPIHAYRDEVRRHATTNLGEVGAVEPGEEARLVVLPTDVRVTKTRRGDRMAIVTVEDDRGAMEMAFFPDAWARSQRALRAGEPVLVVARVERDREEGVKLAGQTAEPISEVRSRTVREVRICVPHRALDPLRIRKLRELLERERGERPARLVVERGGRYTLTYALPEATVRPSQALADAVVAIFGSEASVQWS
jgi:DNA polymerase-3 subunit alpha